jgi:long-chain acyl-CoA synthetase
VIPAQRAAAIGGRTGERLAIRLPDSPRFLVAQLDAVKEGAAVCPFNPTYTEREIEDALTTTDAETLVVMKRLYQNVKRVQPCTSLRRIVTTNVKEFLPPLLAPAFSCSRRSARATGSRWQTEICG